MMKAGCTQYCHGDAFKGVVIPQNFDGYLLAAAPFGENAGTNWRSVLKDCDGDILPRQYQKWYIVPAPLSERIAHGQYPMVALIKRRSVLRAFFSGQPVAIRWWRSHPRSIKIVAAPDGEPPRALFAAYCDENARHYRTAPFLWGVWGSRHDVVFVLRPQESSGG